jgi:hypothetical protein
MDIHNKFILSFMQEERRISGDTDTDDDCVSPDTIPKDDLLYCAPFHSACESAAANSNANSNSNSNSNSNANSNSNSNSNANCNSSIICVADDDDANSVVTAATLNATTTAADNLEFDHPDVVEQLMKLDFDFSDSTSQSICLAHHQDQGQDQSHAEAEPQTQYLGQSEAQIQDQNQCHSPSFIFQVRSFQLRYCKKKKQSFRHISSHLTSPHLPSPPLISFHFILLD